MKRNVLFWSGCMISFMLIIYGCTGDTGDIVTSSDGVRISYEVRGEGSPALIFVHGWSNNRSIWDAQVSHFSQMHKVIAVDLPGFGESGNNRENWTIAAFGDDVASVIDQLNLNQVVLVGFSMGAPVVIETAGKEPDRIIGVVLVDDLQNIEMKYPPEMVGYIDSVFMDLVTNPSIEKLVGGGFVKKNPQTSYERVISMLNSSSKVGWKESLNNTFQWHNEDCIESLKKVRAPMIAINSDRIPTNVEAFRKYVPSFQAKIIQGTGHVVMWDAPEEFNRSLEEGIGGFSDL